MTVAYFNLADYLLLGLMIFSVLISLIRGFIREVLSLLSWIAAFWVTMHFAHQAGELLSHYMKTPSMRFATACVVLFLLTLLLGGVVNYVLGQLIDKTGLSGTDRLIGSVFGLGRGALLVALLLLLGSHTPMKQDPWWQDSVLIPKFQPLVLWLQDSLKDVLPTSIEKETIKLES